MVYLNVCFLLENLLAVVGGVGVVAAVASITPSWTPLRTCPRNAVLWWDNVLQCYQLQCYSGSPYTKLYRVATALRKNSHIYEADG